MQKRSTKVKHYFLQEINPVIRFLIISDTLIIGAAGLMGPIFALFIEEFVEGGDASVAGIAAGIYLISRSVLQIPIAHFLDKVRGEKDDFWLMFIFTICMSLTPLFYLVISTPLHLYIVQFILGFFTAFTFPAYMGIFTRHIDKDKEGTEWGVYFTSTDVAGSALAVVGGYVAVSAGFPILIITISIISFIGALLLWPIKPYIKLK
ncbi:MAG: MFS transporter [bacterium]|nr:MFS transporter [bacterium]